MPPYRIRLLRLSLIRLALAVPMVPWLVLLFFWADAEWTRTATFGQPHPTIITVAVIPLLALLVLIIDALVASTLMRDYLTGAVGLTRSAGALFYRWLAASMIAGLIVAIALRLTAAAPLAIVGCIALGPVLFAAILILRASAHDDEDVHTGATDDADAPVAQHYPVLPPLTGDPSRDDTGELEPVSAAVLLIPPPPLQHQATVAEVEQVSDPDIWRTVATEWAETLRPLQRHGRAGDWMPLARARAEAATVIARGALPFDDMRADQLAVAIDAFRAASDQRELDVACSDLLALVARPRALGPGR